MEVNGYKIEPGAVLRGANLAGVDLNGANLAGADLNGANLAGADLITADLTKADLTKADLTKADLTKANLSGADLTNANLSGAYLTGVNLTGVNLTGVNLGRINLSGINLTGVNLSGVNLGRVNLSGVDLTGVNLRGVNFTGPSLSGINLDGADLRGAITPGGFTEFCDDCGAELLDGDDEWGHVCIPDWPDWRTAGFDSVEALDWTGEGISLRQAKAWRSAGFYPDGEHDVCGWLAWGCTPKQALEYVHQGCEDAPSERLKELGVSLEDAVFFRLNSVDGEDVDYLLDIFLHLGLPRKKIVELKSQLDEASEEFEDMCCEDEDFKGDYNSFFEDSLREMFKSLKSVGLPINIANLKKYWELSGEQILKVIDYGDESRLVSRIIRQGVPTNKIGIAKRLIKLGMTYPAAASLVKHGLTPKHLKLLEKMNEPEEVLWRLSYFEDSDGDIKIEEVLLWLEVPTKGIITMSSWRDTISSWRDSGFTPQEAAKWSEKGFSPKTATRWRDTGVNSPLTAKRRRDAGLNP